MERLGVTGRKNGEDSERERESTARAAISLGNHKTVQWFVFRVHGGGPPGGYGSSNQITHSTLSHPCLA